MNALIAVVVAFLANGDMNYATLLNLESSNVQ
jgi:hypothetical protein